MQNKNVHSQHSLTSLYPCITTQQSTAQEMTRHVPGTETFSNDRLYQQVIKKKSVINTLYHLSYALTRIAIIFFVLSNLCRKS